MLETIREYGLEQLAASGEFEETCRRHANFFLGLAEATEALLLGSKRDVILAQLQAEMNNFRAALTWSQSAVDNDEIGLRLVGTLTWFCHFGNHANEARGWFELFSGSTSTAARAKALWGAGMMDMIQGDYHLARAKLEESATLWRQIGDQPGLAAALRELCAVANCEGQIAAAKRYGEEGVRLCRAMEAQWDLALSHFVLGFAINAEDDHTRAFHHFAECHSLFQALEDTWGISVALGGLGFVACQLGDLATARSRFEEAVVLRRASSDKWNMADALNLLGEVVQRQGELEQANSLYAECLALDHEVGDKAHTALVLHHLGVIAQLQGRNECAARLLAAAATLRQRISGGTFNTFTTAAEYEEDISAVRAALGEETFTAEWTQGEAMELEQAIEYALARPDLSEPTPPSVASGTLLPSPPAYPAGLTAREVDVLRLLAQGLTYAQIAERLVVSWRTVNSHLTSIYSKLGVTSRSEATHFAVKHQL
jgi:DNA-binding NarL/FixJ family response regulator/Tfp pilus assembly protein PilF